MQASHGLHTVSSSMSGVNDSAGTKQARLKSEGKAASGVGVVNINSCKNCENFTSHLEQKT